MVILVDHLSESSEISIERCDWPDRNLYADSEHRKSIMVLLESCLYCKLPENSLVTGNPGEERLWILSQSECSRTPEVSSTCFSCLAKQSTILRGRQTSFLYA